MIELRHVTYTVPHETDAAPEGEPLPVEPSPQATPPEAPLPLDANADNATVRALPEHQGQTAPRGRQGAPTGRRFILDDVSFIVPERSITCIMGVSGSGKTTLLRLMAGLLKPDSGEILIDGRDIAQMNERQLNEVRRGMGFVFQYGALFDSMSIGENVGFGLQQARHPASEIRTVVAQRLADVGLPGIEDKLPSEISGGMKKRVAMARALATNPKIVLYDEPTSGLDPVMARVIDDLIVHLRDDAGTTNVVVSHHLPSILRISDRVLMLYDARIEAEGTPDEVSRLSSPVVRQFLEGRADGPITVM